MKHRISRKQKNQNLYKMSSKEQYKDSLKRANRTIAELNIAISKLNIEILHAQGELHAAKMTSNAFRTGWLHSNKHWWQFWK